MNYDESRVFCPPISIRERRRLNIENITSSSSAIPVNSGQQFSITNNNSGINPEDPFRSRSPRDQQSHHQSGHQNIIMQQQNIPHSISRPQNRIAYLLSTQASNDGHQNQYQHNNHHHQHHHQQQQQQQQQQSTLSNPHVQVQQIISSSTGYTPYEIKVVPEKFRQTYDLFTSPSMTTTGSDQPNSGIYYQNEPNQLSLTTSNNRQIPSPSLSGPSSSASNTTNNTSSNNNNNNNTNNSGNNNYNSNNSVYHHNQRTHSGGNNRNINYCENVVYQDPMHPIQMLTSSIRRSIPSVPPHQQQQNQQPQQQHQQPQQQQHHHHHHHHQQQQQQHPQPQQLSSNYQITPWNNWNNANGGISGGNVGGNGTGSNGIGGGANGSSGQSSLQVIAPGTSQSTAIAQIEIGIESIHNSPFYATNSIGIIRRPDSLAFAYPSSGQIYVSPIMSYGDPLIGFNVTASGGSGGVSSSSNSGGGLSSNHIHSSIHLGSGGGGGSGVGSSSSTNALIGGSISSSSSSSSGNGGASRGQWNNFSLNVGSSGSSASASASNSTTSSSHNNYEANNHHNHHHPHQHVQPINYTSLIPSYRMSTNDNLPRDYRRESIRTSNHHTNGYNMVNRRMSRYRHAAETSRRSTELLRLNRQPESSAEEPNDDCDNKEDEDNEPEPDPPEDLPESESCVICFTYRKEYCIPKCHHLCLCRTCSKLFKPKPYSSIEYKTVNKCPLCRKPLTGKPFKIFR